MITTSGLRRTESSTAAAPSAASPTILMCGAREIIARALERHRDTIRELRDLSFALEPVILRDQGFAPALQALVSQVGATHALRIDLSTDGAEELGDTAQVALYTIIRELLDQAIRRGPPTRVTVHIDVAADGGLRTSVSDDAEPERRRRSFEAIEERVKQLHGTIDVDVHDKGTTTTVSLPPYATARWPRSSNPPRRRRACRSPTSRSTRRWARSLPFA